MASRSGGKASKATIGRIENGVYSGYERRTLEGIAQALLLPMRQVRDAAGLTPEVPEPFVLPDRADELTPRERRLVLELVDVLLTQHRNGGG